MKRSTSWKPKTVNQRLSETLEVLRFINNKTTIRALEDYSIKPGDSRAFLQGVVIEAGIIYCNPSITHPGDLAHEAGHLATIPQSLRELASGELGQSDYFQSYLEELWNKDPRMGYASDTAASGWSILAFIELGFDLPIIFERGYGGEGDRLAAGVQLSYEQKIGNQFTCELFYLGLLESKCSYRPISWEFYL